MPPAGRRLTRVATATASPRRLVVEIDSPTGCHCLRPLGVVTSSRWQHQAELILAAPPTLGAGKPARRGVPSGHAVPIAATLANDPVLLISALAATDGAIGAPRPRASSPAPIFVVDVYSHVSGPPRPGLRGTGAPGPRAVRRSFRRFGSVPGPYTLASTRVTITDPVRTSSDRGAIL